MARQKKKLSMEQCLDLFSRAPDVFTRLVLERIERLNEADAQWAESVKRIERAKLGKGGIVSRAGGPCKDIDETALGVRCLELMEDPAMKGRDEVCKTLAREFGVCWMTVLKRLKEEGIAWQLVMRFAGKNAWYLRRWLVEEEKNPLLNDREVAIEAAHLYRNGIKPEDVIELLPKNFSPIDPIHIEQVGEAAKRGLLQYLLQPR